jgi:hypothetical protein
MNVLNYKPDEWVLSIRLEIAIKMLQNPARTNLQQVCNYTECTLNQDICFNPIVIGTAPVF